MECPVRNDMMITAATAAKWLGGADGAPGPLYCAPKTFDQPYTGVWDHLYKCDRPQEDPPEFCDVYEGMPSTYLTCHYLDFLGKLIKHITLLLGNVKANRRGGMTIRFLRVTVHRGLMLRCVISDFVDVLLQALKNFLIHFTYLP